MNRLKKVLLISAILIFPGFYREVSAKVVLPQILGHNMVLQRNQQVPVWGTADAGEVVTVTFAGQVKQATADLSGKWKIFLDQLKASSKPATLVIRGQNVIKLENIVVGEVWICSGQSNMEYAIHKIIKSPKPLKGADTYPVNEQNTADNPAIRVFLVNRKLLGKPDSTHKGWSVAKDSALRAFSAAGYFFAKKLHEELGIPVGMIESAVSGSAIEPWIPADYFTTLPYFKDKKVGNDPGKFYTTMIAPMAPFAVHGFLWYQGETNCFLKETLSYTYKMQALINSWRSAWGDEKLPFYYVQIAPFFYSKSKSELVFTEETEPEFWEAQVTALKVPNTAMIVTTDLNDSPNDLHPTYKWEIGRRLASIALAKDYGKNVPWSGPVYQSMEITGRSIELRFDPMGKKLVSNDGKPLSHFEIAGPEGKYMPAKAIINGNRVIVTSEEIDSPVAARFGWNEAAQPNFFNSEGLPAMPFRTVNPLWDQFKVQAIRK